MNETVARIHADLDLAGDVLMQGVSTAPDFSMRAIQLIRDVLNRHAEDRGGLCRHEGIPWPCPDVRAVFEFAGEAVGQ